MSDTTTPQPGPPAYQPTPTTPAPYLPAPYTISGVAYVYAPRINPLAVASLVLSLAGLFFIIPAVPGVILGHVALSQIAKRGERGKGLGIAGIAVGYALIGFWLLYIVLVVVMVVALMNGTPG